MLCDDCKFNPRDGILQEFCNGDLHKVESVPDKYGFIVLAYKCSGYEKKAI